MSKHERLELVVPARLSDQSRFFVARDLVATLRPHPNAAILGPHKLSCLAPFIQKHDLHGLGFYWRVLMELKQFVAQTLTQITEGVIEAQKNLHPTGARVNPRMRQLLPQGEKNYASIGWAQSEGGNPVLMVSFDVAVTASEETKTKGGIGVVTGVLSLGSSGATDKGNTAASRIAFQVPLLLPAHPVDEKPAT